MSTETVSSNFNLVTLFCEEKKVTVLFNLLGLDIPTFTAMVQSLWEGVHRD